MTTEILEKKIRETTSAIEEKLQRPIDERSQIEVAELYYHRAELYIAHKNYELAMSDYTNCLAYDPYFYEADMGREIVMHAMMEIDEMARKKNQ